MCTRLTWTLTEKQGNIDHIQQIVAVLKMTAQVE